MCSESLSLGRGSGCAICLEKRTRKGYRRGLLGTWHHDTTVARCRSRPCIRQGCIARAGFLTFLVPGTALLGRLSKLRIVAIATSQTGFSPQTTLRALAAVGAAFLARRQLVATFFLACILDLLFFAPCTLGGTLLHLGHATLKCGSQHGFGDPERCTSTSESGRGSCAPSHTRITTISTDISKIKVSRGFLGGFPDARGGGFFTAIGGVLALYLSPTLRGDQVSGLACPLRRFMPGCHARLSVWFLGSWGRVLLGGLAREPAFPHGFGLPKEFARRAMLAVAVLAVELRNTLLFSRVLGEGKFASLLGTVLTWGTATRIEVKGRVVGIPRVASRPFGFAPASRGCQASGSGHQAASGRGVAVIP